MPEERAERGRTPDPDRSEGTRFLMRGWRRSQRLVARPVLTPIVGRIPMMSTFMLSLSAPAGHGLSQKAVEIAAPFGFPITNSMIVMWIVAAGLILFAQLATRRLKRSRAARKTSWSG